LIIVSIFFTLPVLIKFTKERMFAFKDFENNSKNNFKKILEGKSNTEDSELNKNFVFDDILEFDNMPTDSVRLSASTIEQLFKDTDYNLNKVRKEKLVKPVSLTLLPSEIKMIENTKKRKELFIQIILPLIIKENNYIRLDRKKLFSILNKSKNTRAENNWLGSKFKQYGVINKDLSTLKIRMDEVPVSMAIAQAAKETGWGTSRFAQEGNALFGQWTWSGEGIKPAGADDDSTHKVMRFKVLQASVKAYQRNLNTHSSYKRFRSARASLRDERKKLDSIVLSEYLDKYAETGKEYVRILQQIIRQNQLTDFDDAKLLPSSIELESLI
jgi:Bax protein